MKKEQIARILEDHGVPYQVMDGQVIADSMIAGTDLFEEVETVSNWTRSQLYEWLGY